MESLHDALGAASAHYSRGEIDDALAAANHALDHAKVAGWPNLSMDDLQVSEGDE